MPPRTPKLAGTAAAGYSFPTFDELVAEATEDLPTYELPLGTDGGGDPVVILIPCPNGADYLDILEARARGREDIMLRKMVQDEGDWVRLKAKLATAGFPVVDRLIGNVLSHYYGVGLQIQGQQGNSPAS